MRSPGPIEILAALAASAAFACTDIEAPEVPPAPGRRAFAESDEATHGIEQGWRIVQAADFNFDGMADMLWSEPETNRFAVWLMNGPALLAPGPVLEGPPGDGWEAITAGDFNHDGMADVLFGNPKRNLMAVWLMHGPTVLAMGPEVPGPPGGGARLVPTVEDFNFDGMADVVWNDTRRDTASVWLMRGTAVLAEGPEVPGPPGEGWEAVTVADFNYDGHADLVWGDTALDEMAIWLMSGTAVLAEGPEIPGPVGGGHIVHSAGDFNFDGTSDIQWHHHDRHTLTVWLMDATALLARGPDIPGPSGIEWDSVTNGDVNFDGMQDAVWEAPDPPRMVVDLMHGTALFARGPVIPGPEP